MLTLQNMQSNDFSDWILLSDDTLIVLMIASLLLFIVAIVLAKPWMSGHFGQMRVQKELTKLTRKGATVLNHIQLPDQTGSTFHLDHLVITNRYLIAINMIGYPGNIYGSMRDAMWMQETAQGNNRFPNPFRDQENTKKALASKLGSRQEVHAITVFTAGKLYTTESNHIAHASELAEKLNPFTQDIKIGARRISWASQLINNLVIGDEEGRLAQEKAFLVAQGNPKQLKLAKMMVLTSSSLMLLTFAAVSIRFMGGY